jgi:hypothetical protein
MKSHNTYWNQQIVSLIMLWIMLRRTTTNSTTHGWEWHVNNSTRHNSIPNHRGSSIRFVAMATSIPIQIRWKPATRAWNHIHRLASTSSSTKSNKRFERISKNQSLLVLDVSGIYECQITGPNKNPTETTTMMTSNETTNILENTNDDIHDPERLLGWIDRMTPQPLLYTNHQPYIRAGCRYDLSSILSPSSTYSPSSSDDDSSWTDPIRNSIFVKCRWCQPNVECQLWIHPQDKDKHNNPTRMTWVPSGTCRLRWEKDHSYHPSPNIRLDMGISTEKQRFMQLQMGFFRNRNPTMIQSPRIIVRHKTLWDGQLLSNNIHDPITNFMDDKKDSKDDNNNNHHHHRHKIHPDSWIPNFHLTTSGRLEVSNTIRWRDNDQGRIHIRWSRSLPGGSSSSSSSMDNGGWWWTNLFHDNDDDDDKEHSWTHCHLEVRHKVSNSYHLGTVSLVCQGFLESFRETCQIVVHQEQIYPIGISNKGV